MVERERATRSKRVRWLKAFSASIIAAIRRRPRGDAVRPGRVVELRGIIFQCDTASTVGEWFIRPFSKLNRRIIGLESAGRGAPPRAMHAGLHVVVDVEGERRAYVAEQLVGTRYETLHNGLNWTPLDEFIERDGGGWHVTVAATAFRAVDQAAVREAVERLNQIEGRPFVSENCVAFIERIFGGRRLFADSPLLRALGLHIPLADPALPLLRRDARLDPQTETLLRADALRCLPNAAARSTATPAGARIRLVGLMLAGALVGSWIGNRLAKQSRSHAVELKAITLRAILCVSNFIGVPPQAHQWMAHPGDCASVCRASWLRSWVRWFSC